MWSRILGHMCPYPVIEEEHRLLPLKALDCVAILQLYNSLKSIHPIDV